MTQAITVLFLLVSLAAWALILEKAAFLGALPLSRRGQRGPAGTGLRSALWKFLGSPTREGAEELLAWARVETPSSRRLVQRLLEAGFPLDRPRLHLARAAARTLREIGGRLVLIGALLRCAILLGLAALVGELGRAFRGLSAFPAGDGDIAASGLGEAARAALLSLAIALPGLAVLAWLSRLAQVRREEMTGALRAARAGHLEEQP